MSNPFLPMGVPVARKQQKAQQESDGKKKSLVERLESYEIDALDERNRFEAIDQFNKYSHMADSEFLEQLNDDARKAYEQKVSENQALINEFRREKELLKRKIHENDRLNEVTDIQRENILPSLQNAIKRKKIIQGKVELNKSDEEKQSVIPSTVNSECLPVQAKPLNTMAVKSVLAGYSDSSSDEE